MTAERRAADTKVILSENGEGAYVEAVGKKPGEDGTRMRVKIRIIRSARKTMAVEVKRGGEVLVRIPYGVSGKQLFDFLLKYSEWIVKSYEKSMNSWKQGKRTDTTGAPAYDSLSAADKAMIKSHFLQRVSFFCEKMGVSVNRVSVRDQRTRWGSCSAKGNVNFNYRLFFMDGELLDYVVVHELAHRTYMDHSVRFWQEVGRYDPDYRKHRRALRQYRIE